MVTNCVPTSPYASGLGQTKPQSHNVTVDQQFKQCSSQPRHATWLSNCLEVLYQALRAVRSVGDAWRGMARFAAVGLAAVRWAWYGGSPHLGRAEREIGVRHSRTQKSFVGKTSLCFMLSCFLAFVQPPI